MKKHLLPLLLCLTLLGCDPYEDRARTGPLLTPQDMQNLTMPPTPAPMTDFSTPSLPSPPKAPAPSIPKRLLKPVSITITEKVPLRQALYQLARQSNVDLQLGPTITATIVFTASHRPFLEVLKDICDLAGLRLQVIGQSVRIEVDSPYTKNYNVQFLNVSRGTENRTSIATDVFTNEFEKRNNLDNGSNSIINAKGNADFWSEVEHNLQVLLSQLSDEGGAPSYTIHKQAGIITIYAKQKQHQQVADYLTKIRRAATAQVIIEAKVIEVALTEEFRAGIDWRKVGGHGFQMNMPLGAFSRQTQLKSTGAPGDVLTLGFQGSDFSALINAISQFGNARMLSSPRLTVMNNQMAILKVAQNQVYFQLHYDKHYSTQVDRESISVSSDIHTVPIGLVLSVQPSIDVESGEVILSLRPTISRLTRSVRDPAVDIAFNSALSTGKGGSSVAGGVQPTPSLIPVVEVREIDSVLRLNTKQNQIAVLGGLMEVRSRGEKSNLPLASDVEFFGKIFESTANAEEVVELVILLKATLVEEDHTLCPADQRLVTNYTQDSRPITQSF